MKIAMISLAVGATLSTAPVAAQAADPVASYIDDGFALMDANRNGQVDRAEFAAFMRTRLAKQAQQLDTAFAEIDQNRDGKISKAEAGKVPDLAENFAEVDSNADGGIDKSELRTAAAQAQMQEAGLEK